MKEADYETVGAALLWTIEQGLGDSFTPAVREAWSEAYLLIATLLRRGATPTGSASATRNLVT